jgi:hypothetical protein
MTQEHANNAGTEPPKPQAPTAQQVAAALAALSLVGPAALGGMPVIPVTIEDERRRKQDEIQQVVESSVGVYQTSAEAESALATSQWQLALATQHIENVDAYDVREQDVVRAANRVFSGDADEKSSKRFRSAFNRVAWDTVDLFILRDNEAAEDSGAW